MSAKIKAGMPAEAGEDTISIEELEIWCIVGVLPEERTREQPVLVSIDIEGDLAAAAASGDLDATIDYATLSDRITALVRGGEFKLIETMAERVAAEVLAAPGTTRVRVRVRKPRAISAADAAAVTIVRVAGTGKPASSPSTDGVSRPAISRARWHSRQAGRPEIVGVLNLSPESTVPGSVVDPEDTLERARALQADGADWIELGARSINPTAPPVLDDEEQDRLLPVVRRLVDAGFPVAVDTWSPTSAYAALDAGAGMINFTAAPVLDELLDRVAASHAILVATYMPFADPVAAREAEPGRWDPRAVLAYFAELARRVPHHPSLRLAADPNAGIFHPGIDEYDKITRQVRAVELLPAIADLGLSTYVYCPRKSAETSRIIMARLILDTGVDYLRMHEPAIASRLLAMNGV